MTQHEDGRAESVRQRDPFTKAFAVLDILVDHPDDSLGVRELAQLLGTPPSSTHRILAMLNAGGLVARTDDGRYAIGFEMQRLAWRVSSRFSAPAVAEPILRELTEEVGETSALGLFDPVRNQVTFAATALTRHRLRYMEDLFHSLPLHAGATGLSILAFLSKPLRDEIIRGSELSAFTDRTLTTPDDLEAAMEEVRRQGYACTMGQRAEGAVGIGAPVWDKNRGVLGNVILTLPEQRFDPATLNDLASSVMRAAERMTVALGGVDPR